jgi:hypothetical protein
MPAGMVRAPSDRSRLSLASQAVETQTDAAVMDKFWTLASDEERLALLWQQPILHDVLVFEPEFVAKSNEQSIKYREAGNKYFQQNRHFNALEEYNKSVLCQIRAVDKNNHLLTKFIMKINKVLQ